MFDVSSEGIPPYSRSKVVGYPPVPEGVEGLGVGGHKDGGGLTLLAQDEVGGLEVQAWNGEWINARPIKGVLVINIGQVMYVFFSLVSTRLSLPLLTRMDIFAKRTNVRFRLPRYNPPSPSHPRINPSYLPPILLLPASKRHSKPFTPLATSSGNLEEDRRSSRGG